MIRRIVGYFFFIMLIASLILYFSGITYVEFNGGYYNFLKGLAYEYKDYLWIRIPMLDLLNYSSDIANDSTGILEVLQAIANGFLNFINFISTIINFFLDIVFYIFSLFKVLLGFSDYISVFQ